MSVCHFFFLTQHLCELCNIHRMVFLAAFGVRFHEDENGDFKFASYLFFLRKGPGIKRNKTNSTKHLNKIKIITRFLRCPSSSISIPCLLFLRSSLPIVVVVKTTLVTGLSLQA